MTSLQIEYFLAAARHMSFTKAARALYVTQPSLSKQIASLEADLGLQLFDRSVKTQLRLTRQGELLRDYFSQSREEFRRVLAQAAAELGAAPAVLPVGVVEGLDLIRRIGPVLEQWRQRYPQTELVFQRQPPDRLNQDLLDGKYDLIIQLDILLRAAPGIQGRVIGRENGVFLYAASNPLADRAELSPRDFRDEPLYVLDSDGAQATRRADLEYCRSLGFTPRMIPMPNGDSILHAIGGGRGYGVFHPWTQYVHDSSFRCLETTQPIALSVAWRKGSLPEQPQRFRDDLCRHLQAEQG